VNTVPTRLVRFQAELESAIARERARRPRRLAVRTTVVAAAAAAVTLGVLGALPGNEPSVVERAAAALRAVDGTILHTVLVGTMTEPGGTSTAVRIETWQASSSAAASRSPRPTVSPSCTTRRRTRSTRARRRQKPPSPPRPATRTARRSSACSTRASCTREGMRSSTVATRSASPPRTAA
jgi:hypothetical protein